MINALRFKIFNSIPSKRQLHDLEISFGDQIEFVIYKYGHADNSDVYRKILFDGQTIGLKSDGLDLLIFENPIAQEIDLNNIDDIRTTVRLTPEFIANPSQIWITPDANFIELALQLRGEVDHRIGRTTKLPLNEGVYFTLGTHEDGIQTLTISTNFGKTVISSTSEKVSPIETKPTTALSLEIKPGTASPEVISDLLSEISLLYRKAGGSGINFTLDHISITENEKAI